VQKRGDREAGSTGDDSAMIGKQAILLIDVTPHGGSKYSHPPSASSIAQCLPHPSFDE
jgi:hypothetical protein